MDIISRIREMRKQADKLRQEGTIIALVPTMGYLHEGHLSLMREGKRCGDVLVISIFVNPAQFGPNEDFAGYPRDMDRDLALADEVGVDIVFSPEVEDMYPTGFQTYVDVAYVTKNLCGASRPSHFRGVTTVVAKLFNIVRPHIAIFGQKDYQQLVTIQRMAADLDMDVQIVGAPTVREPDGLAMSSRNSYLSPEERTAALCLVRSLERGEALYREGVRDASRIVQEVRGIIESEPLAQIDYVKVCDAVSIEDIGTIERDAVIALAVRIGKARLIDNTILKGD
jgi:pantoate--beta-alanine ligase